MTWHSRTKNVQDGVGGYTLPVVCKVLSQSSSAAADYVTNVFAALPYTVDTGYLGPGSNIGDPATYSGVTDLYLIRAAYLVTATAVTGTGAAGAGATANINLIGTAGTSLGTLFTLQFNTSTNTVAGVALSLGSITTISGRAYGTTAVAIRSTESIQFEWLQGATGLALPESLVVLDIT